MTEATSEFPIVTLTSGQTLKIKGVKLYDEQRVNEVASIRAAAMKSLGGVSTGIGFWGSPGWALGGALALGLLESALSSSAREQGIKMLNNAEIKYRELLAGARLFNAGELNNFASPHPEAWRGVATVARRLDVSSFGWLERKSFLKRHNKTNDDILSANGFTYIEVHERRAFIHNGDEFIGIETELGIIEIKWSQVVAYFPSRPPTAAVTSTQIAGEPRPMPEWRLGPAA